MDLLLLKRMGVGKVKMGLFFNGGWERRWAFSCSNKRVPPRSVTVTLLPLYKPTLSLNMWPGTKNANSKFSLHENKHVNKPIFDRYRIKFPRSSAWVLISNFRFSLVKAIIEPVVFLYNFIFGKKSGVIPPSLTSYIHSEGWVYKIISNLMIVIYVAVYLRRGVEGGCLIKEIQ